MRKRWHLCAGVIAGLAVLLGAGGETVEVETRTFEGVGSVGIETPFEMYLPNGRFTHDIVSDSGCALTSGVFPADRQPAVPFQQVLQADLAVGVSGRAGPNGTFDVSEPGWANVQVGTGPDCAWTYRISGPFLPEGREPGPPGALRQPWVLWVAIAAAATVVWRAMRHHDVVDPAEPEPKVTVLDG